MDWRRLVSDDANETDLLRSCAVRVADGASGSESGTCFAVPHSPWSLPFAPPTPLRASPLQDVLQEVLPLCSPASSLL
jgi:hypothetical protein